MTAGIITVRFTGKDDPTSRMIGLLAGSKEFSHVMTIIDGTAYEATIKHGCRVVSVTQAMAGVVRYQEMYVPVPDIELAVKFGQAQNGKGYDFNGAMGIPFLASEDWADWSKWWCSELSFMQIAQGGNWVLDPAFARRVTPTHLLMCNYNKSKIMYN